MLDFDPCGEIVEVLQGRPVILESLFPDELLSLFVRKQRLPAGRLGAGPLFQKFFR